MRKFILVVVLIAVLPLVLTGCSGKSTTPAQNTRPTQKQLDEHLGNTKTPVTVPQNASGTKIDLVKYNLVQDGMTYEEVATIMGSPGTKMGESTSADPAKNYVEYQWLQGDQGANGTFDFVGNKLIGKAQFGLH